MEIHYPQWRRVSKPIERFTVLLDSLTRLIEGKIFILIKENYAFLVNYHYHVSTFLFAFATMNVCVQCYLVSLQ